MLPLNGFLSIMPRGMVEKGRFTKVWTIKWSSIILCSLRCSFGKLRNLVVICLLLTVNRSWVPGVPWTDFKTCWESSKCWYTTRKKRSRTSWSVGTYSGLIGQGLGKCLMFSVFYFLIQASKRLLLLLLSWNMYGRRELPRAVIRLVSHVQTCNLSVLLICWWFKWQAGICRGSACYCNGKLCVGTVVNLFWTSEDGIYPLFLLSTIFVKFRIHIYALVGRRVMTSSSARLSYPCDVEVDGLVEVIAGKENEQEAAFH